MCIYADVLITLLATFLIRQLCYLYHIYVNYPEIFVLETLYCTHMGIYVLCIFTQIMCVMLLVLVKIILMVVLNASLLHVSVKWLCT